MIKGILASNTAKLVAACVCPVAGTVGLTVASPKVRQKIHNATAPRAYALPKTRVRQAPAAAVPAPVQTAMAAPPASRCWSPARSTRRSRRPAWRSTTARR